MSVKNLIKIFKKSKLFKLQSLIILLTSNFTLFSQEELSILSSKFPQELQKSDFIFVIDRSGSMKKYWPYVSNAIVNFIDAIPDGDYISILYFESTAGELITPRELSPQTKNTIKELISKLPPPKGAFTDLLAGIDRTIDELNRPQNNPIQFVFFFTDFINEPPPQSKYNSPEILNKLKLKLENILSSGEHIIKVYTLILPLSSNYGKDLNLFEHVFGSIEIVTIHDPSSLIQWFLRKKLELKREKIKAQVQSELKNSFIILDPQGEKINIKANKTATFKVKTKSTFKKLDVSITDIDSFSTEIPNITVEVEPLNLKPGDDAILKLKIKSTKINNEFFPRFEPFKGKIYLTLKGVINPEKELKKININPTFTKSLAISLNGNFVYGVSLWLFILFGFIILLTIGSASRIIWKNFKPAYLHLYIYDIKRPVNSPAVNIKYTRNMRISKITIGSPVSDIRIPGNSKVEIIAIRKQENLKRGTYVKLIQGSAKLNGNYLTINSPTLIKNNSKLEMEGYTLVFTNVKN